MVERAALLPQPVSLDPHALHLWRTHGDGHWLPLAGHSMLPLLRTGDQVQIVVQPHYRVGDIVLFVVDGQLWLHRLVVKPRRLHSVAAATWLTQGDNCDAPDTPLASAQILGKVIARRRNQHLLRFDRYGWSFASWLVARCARPGVGIRWRRPLQRLLLRLLARLAAGAAMPPATAMAHL